MRNVIIGLSLVVMSLSSFAADTCGTEGTVEERIQDCGKFQNGNFVLVAKVKAFKQIFSVYKDLKTNLLWSDRLYPNTLNHTNAVRACEYLRAEMANIDEVIWELPTLNNYKQADKHGIRKSLPNMDSFFWTATENRDNPLSGWMFNGVYGDISSYNRNNGTAHVRCVGQVY